MRARDSTRTEEVERVHGLPLLWQRCGEVDALHILVEHGGHARQGLGGVLSLHTLYGKPKRQETHRGRCLPSTPIETFDVLVPAM